MLQDLKWEGKKYAVVGDVGDGGRNNAYRAETMVRQQDVWRGWCRVK